ncbi:unnamed protein product [Parnassius apollo]|uniref:(apollo) hypothetical protein n=1 Tax=Parnassius apollo TaxID=110799 RepID=A0A8S3X4N8_PARAO|nr:unnamed protein product [Parnassius apollo]
MKDQLNLSSLLVITGLFVLEPLRTVDWLPATQFLGDRPPSRATVFHVHSGSLMCDATAQQVAESPGQPATKCVNTYLNYTKSLSLSTESPATTGRYNAQRALTVVEPCGSLLLYCAVNLKY